MSGGGLGANVEWKLQGNASELKNLQNIDIFHLA